MKTKIPLNEKSLHHYPTDGCNVESKYRQNIAKHLKSCDSPKKKRKFVANNKMCPICSKVISQNSNRDRQITECHRPYSNAFNECIEPIEDETIQSMVFPVDLVVPEVVDAIPTAIPEKDNKDVVQLNEQSASHHLYTQKKQSRLEKNSKIQVLLCYSMNILVRKPNSQEFFAKTGKKQKNIF